MSIRAGLPTFSALTAAFLLIACDKGAGPEESDSQNLLTAKGWVMKSHTVEPGLEMVEGEEPVTDMLSSRADCVKDDIHRFSKSGSYTLEDGETVCPVEDGDGPDLDLRWNLNAAGSKISFTKGGNPTNQDWMVETLTGTTLKVKVVSSEEWLDGKVHTQWMEFQAQ